MKRIYTIPNPPPVQYRQRAFISLACSAVLDGIDACGVHAVYREFTPERPAEETAVRYQHYAVDPGAGFSLLGDSRLLHAGGEDPRAFVWRGQPWCLFCQYDAASADWRQFVAPLDSSLGGPREIQHDLEFAGKNWMPTTGDRDTLLIVRSLEPLCVLQLKPDMQCQTLIRPTDMRFIGERRGGGAAHAVYLPGDNSDDLFTSVHGWGHRTCGPDDHRAFEFNLMLEGTGSPLCHLLIGKDQSVVDQNWAPETGLHDPTGLYNRVVTLCHAKTGWLLADQEIVTSVYG